jgi:hypothetical protein
MKAENEGLRQQLELQTKALRQQLELQTEALRQSEKRVDLLIGELLLRQQPGTD